MTDSLLKYREQHKHRLNYMPWLYWTLKPKHRVWAEEWQKRISGLFNGYGNGRDRGELFYFTVSPYFCRAGTEN